MASLFLGCRSGKIYELTKDRNVKLISEASRKNIEYLEFLPSENVLIFDGSPSASNPYVTSVSYSINSKALGGYELSSLKDVKYVGEGKYLVGHNMGMMWFEPAENKYEHIPEFAGRTNAVAFEEKSQTIYSGSSSGLMIGTKKEINFFELNEQPVICKHMLNYKSKIYISTQKNGILVFQDGRVLENWTVDKGLPSNNILENVAESKRIYYLN